MTKSEDELARAVELLKSVFSRVDFTLDVVTFEVHAPLETTSFNQGKLPKEISGVKILVNG